MTFCFRNDSMQNVAEMVMAIFSNVFTKVCLIETKSQRFKNHQEQKCYRLLTPQTNKYFNQNLMTAHVLAIITYIQYFNSVPAHINMSVYYYNDWNDLLHIMCSLIKEQSSLI